MAASQPDYKQHHEQTRKSWNQATPAHNSHKSDQAKKFKDGGSTLFPEEIELLGELEGKSLIHLQCNCGQDTLSLALLGAKATGVDISDESITMAQRISTESGVKAEFVRADVLDFFAEYSGPEVDIVFCSYGTLAYLCDLNLWAQGVQKLLKPGGKFVIVEFQTGIHIERWIRANPITPEELETVKACKVRDMAGAWREIRMDPQAQSTSSSSSQDLANTDAQQPPAPIKTSGVVDYVAMAMAEDRCRPSEFAADFQNPEPAILFPWTTDQVKSALALAGMEVDSYEEYSFWNTTMFIDPCASGGDTRRNYLPKGFPPVTGLMYSISAHKPLKNANQ